MQYVFLSIICITWFLVSSSLRADGTEVTATKCQGPVIAKIMALKKKNKIITASANIPTILVSLKDLGDSILNQGFRKISIKISDGFETKGYALTRSAAYPTIVLVAGLGSSSEMAAFRHYVRPFLKSKWNIILLENSTNAEWIARNHHIQVSGYEAGWTLYQTLKSLREHPNFAEYTKKINLMGLSLGGNDIVYASYFDSKLGTSVINGAVLAWSSPVNRLASLKRLREVKGLPKLFSGIIFSGIYDEAYNFMDELTDKPFEWFAGEASMEEVLKEVLWPASSRFFSDHPEVPLPNKKISQSLSEYKKLFQLEDFIKDIKQPILWIHSLNDTIVLVDDNVSGFASLNPSCNIGLAITQHGGHLGFPKSYGKKWLSRVINTYFDYWKAD